MINIFLADDHRAVRQELISLLKKETDFVVVGEASNGLEAVEMVERLCPDVLILDIMMPKMTGLEAAGILGKTCPSTQIIMLSMHKDEGYISEAFRLGAKAYVLKDNSAEELIAAVRQVNQGKYFLGPSMDLPSIDNDNPNSNINKSKQ
jgi:DNA-binding NarL/FixJ family response regulator